jgi:hypothetical protein
MAAKKKATKLPDFDVELCEGGPKVPYSFLDVIITSGMLDDWDDADGDDVPRRLNIEQLRRLRGLVTKEELVAELLEPKQLKVWNEHVGPLKQWFQKKRQWRVIAALRVEADDEEEAENAEDLFIKSVDSDNDSPVLKWTVLEAKPVKPTT